MSFSNDLAKACNELSRADPIMANLISTYGKCRITPHDDYFGELVDSIISQQLSVKAAATIKQRFMDLFDGELPIPQKLLDCDDEVIRKCGVSYQKISYMKDLSLHVLQGTLDIKHITSLSNDELVEQLTAVRGLGVWSAHMFMIFSLGRLDVLPFGDLGVKKAAMLAYKLDGLPNQADLEELSKTHNWAPYQSVAAWYLWQSLNNT